MTTSGDIIKWLKLQPNTVEGGYLAGTYESPIKLADASLPGFPITGNSRPLCGAIYYFLGADDISILHKVTGDMVYHFYSGDPVQMLLLFPPGFPNRTEVFNFNNEIGSGGGPMKVIPGGTWLGSRLIPGGNYALMGVTMAPGFHPNDYAIGERDKLINEYPEQKDMIESLTKQSGNK
jgi:predicted cupin superfamily sugar epimerase